MILEREFQRHFLRGFGRDDEAGFFAENAHGCGDERGCEHGAVEHNYGHGVNNRAQGVEPKRPRDKIVEHGREKENDRRHEHPKGVDRA